MNLRLSHWRSYKFIQFFFVWITQFSEHNFGTRRRVGCMHQATQCRDKKPHFRGFSLCHSTKEYCVKCCWYSIQGNVNDFGILNIPIYCDTLATRLNALEIGLLIADFAMWRSEIVIVSRFFCLNSACAKIFDLVLYECFVCIIHRIFSDI